MGHPVITLQDIIAEALIAEERRYLNRKLSPTELGQLNMDADRRAKAAIKAFARAPQLDQEDSNVV